MKFENGSRVVFLGDSITANGTWMRRILQYYRENTDIRFEMYNAGVSGDTASGALQHMKETVLRYNPTDVVVMFGMNDAGRTFYKGDVTEDAVLNRRMMIDKSVFSIKQITNELASRKIRVILCSPTIYDELTDSAEENFVGVQTALREIGERAKVFAKESKLLFVDFNSKLFEISKNLYKSGETFIGGDRVHPTPLGHELMARVFLKTQGFDVEIPTSLDAMKELSNHPFDEWEEKRYALERKLIIPKFVDRCLFGGIKKSENVEKLAKEYAEKCTSDFIKNSIGLYPDYAENEEKHISELVAHTKTAYLDN